MPLRSVDFFSRVFVCFFLIAILTIPSGNSARAQTPDDQVRALITALKKLGSVEGETSKLIDRLRAEINDKSIVNPETLSRNQVDKAIFASLPALAGRGPKFHVDATAEAIAKAVLDRLKERRPQQSAFGGSKKGRWAILRSGSTMTNHCEFQVRK